MSDDLELLRHYATDRSETAFAELVQRNLPLVYNAALRRLHGDAHAAEDVVQIVFSDLARHAPTLQHHRHLVGWFFTSAHFAATKHIRTEARRRRREQEALLMDESKTTLPAALDWEQLRPLIDRAMLALKEGDREALLLRFFQGRKLAEIGRSLGITEDAARMRIERAIERLRSGLAKHRITSTSAALAVALGNHVVIAAPAALASSVTSTALASASATTIAVAAAPHALRDGSLAIFTMAKIKTGAIGLLALAGVVSVLLQVQTSRALTAELKTARRGAHELGRLRQANARLSADIARITPSSDNAELTRLRQQIATLKAQPLEVDEAQMRPVAQMHHAGWATPEAAFETLTWAQNQPPEIFWDTFARSFVFDARTKARADAFFATLPEAVRARLRTSERLFAPLFFGSGSEANPIEAVQLLSREHHDRDPHQIVLRWWQRSASGTGFEGRVLLTRHGDDWLQVRQNPIREEAWNRIIARINPATGEVLSETPGKP